MKKYFASLFIFITLVLTMQNCGGSRVLSADLNVSREQIDAQLNAIYSNSAASGNFATAAAIGTFFQILDNDPNATLFYSEAPGSMGTVSSVMSFDWGSFGVDTPSNAYAYYVFTKSGNAPRGAVLITTGNETSQTVVVAMANDGQSLAPGSFGDVDFAMEMAVGTGSAIVRSYDIIDGDFAETLQLEIYNPTDSGSEEFLGLITFTQPTN